MTRAILITLCWIVIIGGTSGSIAGPDIRQIEAEAAIESAFGWMACGALIPAGTYVESSSETWELSSVQTVGPDHLAVLDQVRHGLEIDRKNRSVLAFSLLGWPIVVCGVILVVALIALRTRGGSRPRYSSAHAFRLDHRQPRSAQRRNHWTVHEDE